MGILIRLRRVGEPLVVHVSRRFTGYDLKKYLQLQFGLSLRRYILLRGAFSVGDAQRLSELAAPLWPDRCVLQDVIAAPSYLPMELDLTFVLLCNSCVKCETVAEVMRHCPGCGAHYCSIKCQRSAWPEHKPVCHRS